MPELRHDALVSYHDATTPFTPSPLPQLHDLRGYTNESMDSIEYPDKLRILRSDAISLKGFAIIAFCKSIIEPNFESFADSLQVLSLDLNHLSASHDSMGLVARTFKAIPNLKELIFLGFPEAAVDEHGIFDSVPFSLERFKTDLSPATNSMVRFLPGQRELEELQILYTPTTHIRSHSDYENFPRDIVPGLKSLECAGPTLVSLLLSSSTPQLRHLRVNLNRLSRGEESDSLAAIFKLRSTLRSLSLQRKSTKHSQMSMADVLEKVTHTEDRWRLKCLELQDNSYDPVSLQFNL